MDLPPPSEHLPTRHIDAQESDPDPLHLALDAVAGGDPQVLEGLRRIAWEGYILAGLPYGSGEEGMAAWWEARMRAAPW